MRSAVAVAGFAALVAADTYTLTETADVTITSCAADVTNCPGNNGWAQWTAPAPPKPVVTSSSWANWQPSAPVKPTTTSEWKVWTTSAPVAPTGTWSAWSSAASSMCPSYTEKAPPAWFSQLPSDVLSSVEAKWTNGPPMDWCYYTYSTSAPVAPATAAGSSWAQWTPTTSAPVAPYTGAANANGASLAVAGLAAAAAVVFA